MGVLQIMGSRCRSMLGKTIEDYKTMDDIAYGQVYGCRCTQVFAMQPLMLTLNLPPGQGQITLKFIRSRLAKSRIHLWGTLVLLVIACVGLCLDG